MIRALLYLQATTARNTVVQRLKRLKQPKYLVGGLVGAAYFWFFVFRHMFQTGAPRGAGASVPAELLPFLEPLAASLLLVIVLGAWLLGNSRAALQFTEAEVAFLFPAPLTRRTLIHFKLLRSQAGILLSALFLTFIFRRSAVGGGYALAHAVGWWLMLSTLNLHFLGASFVRERLLNLGISPVRRSLLYGSIVLALGTGCWLALRTTVPAPTEDDIASLTAASDYVQRVFSHAPVSWIIAPFAVLVRPYLAATGAEFLRALGPALLLLAAHYVWVVRSNVSFEEASLALAAKRAERVAALREGRWRTRQLPTKPRPEPFPLRVPGWAPLAYLWKNLIALGPWFRLRTWLIACVGAAALLSWLGAHEEYRALLKVVGVVAVSFGAWLFVIGPMFMRREAQQTVTQMDMTKVFPLAGWQVVLGELLTPMVLLTFAQWFLLLVAVMAHSATAKSAVAALVWGGTGAVSIACLTPVLCGLMLCVPYAGLLFFPAWAQASGSHGGGVEVMGQRMIFMAGYLLVLAVTLAPAVGVGGAVFLVVNWFASPAVAVIPTALAAAVVLGAELALAVWWLGQKLERFDLSTELPR